MFAFVLILITGFAATVQADGSCGGNPYAKYIFEHVHAELRSQGSKLSKLNLVNFNYYENHQWNEHDDSPTGLLAASGVTSNNELRTYLASLYNLGSGITNYTCTPMMIGSQNAIRAKLYLGTSDLYLRTNFEYWYNGNAGVDVYLVAHIEPIVVNVLIWLDETTYTLTLEQVVVENFKFGQLDYHHHPFNNGHILFQNCDASKESIIRWISHMKHYLNAEIRPQFEKEVVGKLIRGVVGQVKFDSKRYSKVRSFFNGLFGKALQAKLHEQDVQVNVKGSITPPMEFFNLEHIKIVGLDQVTLEGLDYDFAKQTFKGTFSSKSVLLKLLAQVDLKTEALPHEVYDIPISAELAPIEINFEVQDSGSSLTLTRVVMSNPQNQTQFVTNTRDSVVKGELEQHVLQGSLHGEFYKLFTELQTELQSYIRYDIETVLKMFQN